MRCIRVMLADDHPVVRTGIRNLLEKHADIVVVGEATNGLEALRIVEELKPDVLLLDMEMPGLSGVEVARRLKSVCSTARLLVLSAYDDEQYIFALLSSGAAGYLTKDEVPTMIGDAVRGIANGEEGWLSRRVTAKVLQRNQAAQQRNDTNMLLSSRERQVLQLVAQGRDNEQIGATLNISDGTVKNHVTNIYSKLGVRTRAEAVALAWQQGLA